MSPLALAQLKSQNTQTKQVEQDRSIQPEKSVQTTFTALMTAIEENNYANFVSQGNITFKQRWESGWICD